MATITRISNDTRLSFTDTLQQILSAVVSCMETEKGSIMLAKGRRYLSVAASTDPRLIGIKQALEEDTPSSWVFKNKKMLSIGKSASRNRFEKRFDHYKKAAFLLIPILIQNKVIGIISVTEKLGTDRFTKSDQEILLTLASHVISALENHRLAESLRKSKRMLGVKNRRLKELERIRTELFNMLIHDLKGPISEVLANIDILSYTVTGENLEYVESARTGCDTLFRMVVDLLDIVKMEEQNLELNVEKMTPSDLIREAITRLKGLSQSRSITLKEASPGMDSDWVEIEADRGILLRVLQNLLTNAIQFSPSGEAVLCGYDPIGADTILFYVEDKGPGIPYACQDAVFDKFTRLSSRKDGRKYTTGLGLTFCKMAVELHKGTIRIISDGVRGTRFEFMLPR